MPRRAPREQFTTGYSFFYAFIFLLYLLHDLWNNVYLKHFFFLVPPGMFHLFLHTLELHSASSGALWCSVMVLTQTFQPHQVLQEETVVTHLCNRGSQPDEA